MTIQIAIRVPDELVARLDELVAAGSYESRAAAVRAGIEVLMALDRRRTTDNAIVEGYLRMPSSSAEKHSALASLRDAIAEESW